jgi:uncharacterized protein YdeI (YjbR/CyaY-like superfamily)
MEDGRMEPVYFESGAALRAWLETWSERADELLIGFYKKGTERARVTYQEALDEALCYGWIDGVRKGVDAERYTIRFTPRRLGSVWSVVNIARVEELRALGRMRPAGLAAFEKRDSGGGSRYSYEAERRELSEPYVARFQERPDAWAFFQAQPSSYRRVASWFVMSAKKPETQARRLEKLIRCSVDGLRLPEAAPPRRSASAESGAAL